MWASFVNQKARICVQLRNLVFFHSSPTDRYSNDICLDKFCPPCSFTSLCSWKCKENLTTQRIESQWKKTLYNFRGFVFFVLKFYLLFLTHTVFLFFCFKQKRLRMVSILGAGLLVGTALAVIIPEGVHALYESDQHGEKSVSVKFLHSPILL